ncbi:MAG: ATP-binding protein [Bacteroidales bacterium]|nr:ATP-binding protein [Bacteroidales bacterium]
MKKIPTDVYDFVTLREENYYFFDKSGYIRELENQKKSILLVRPRRMGKTLFSSMLMAYYDINLKDRFQELFGDLAIGKNPTEWANKYLALRFDFSHVDNSDIDLLKVSFDNYCQVCISDFLTRYNWVYTQEERAEILALRSVKNAIVCLVTIAHNKGRKVFLTIDEYDNFTNTVLAARGVKAHKDITHGEGFYRSFFSGLKGTFDRIFLTGVSPATYDDLTSGFNIADLVSLMPWFAQAIGVTETELKEMIEYYRNEGALEKSSEEIISEIKPWYDNFCFSEECYGVAPTIYNTQMVVRYMHSLVNRGRAPQPLLDISARVDPQKLHFLVMSEDLGDRKERISIIKEICTQGFTLGNVEIAFQAGEAGEEKNFKSLLYYYGTLTFGPLDEYGRRMLIVPNMTMRDLYLRYMLRVIEEERFVLNGQLRVLNKLIAEAAVKGAWEPFAEELGKLCQQYSSLRNNTEPNEQAFLRGVLCQNDYYDVWPELELGEGYCDVLLVPKNVPNNPARYSYLFELKHMSARSKSPDAKIKEACAQLRQYISDAYLENSPLLGHTTLVPLYLIFRNHRLITKGRYNE